MSSISKLQASSIKQNRINGREISTYIFKVMFNAHKYDLIYTKININCT